jgi:hypothetical protein
VLSEVIKAAQFPLPAGSGGSSSSSNGAGGSQAVPVSAGAAFRMDENLTALQVGGSCSSLDSFCSATFFAALPPELEAAAGSKHPPQATLAASCQYLPARLPTRLPACLPPLQDSLGSCERIFKTPIPLAYTR